MKMFPYGYMTRIISLIFDLLACPCLEFLGFTVYLSYIRTFVTKKNVIISSRKCKVCESFSVNDMRIKMVSYRSMSIINLQFCMRVLCY
jgi:hypothetical protein